MYAFMLQLIVMVSLLPGCDTLCSAVHDDLRRTESRSDIYYIGVDKQPSSARETSSPAAFDELFKFHFVLSLSDEECLALIYTFVLASVYNVDAGTTTEAVCELQAKTKTPSPHSICPPPTRVSMLGCKSVFPCGPDDETVHCISPVKQQQS
ncbi:hypothetical protein NQZ68_001222 [Dissostichus eleginoides]|nr:hypothetical protein NQZ68_001222 [Dissostichus eleginoides]